MATSVGRLEIDSVSELADLVAHFEQHKHKLGAMLTHRIDPALAPRIGAEDLLSETFILARRRWREFAASEMTSYAWLYRLALDCLIEAQRRATAGRRNYRKEVPWPQQASVVLGERLADSTTTPGTAAARAELRRMVCEALDQLDISNREVLWMRHFDDMKYREIGQVLNISTEAATKRYVRALERLRAIWRNDHPADTSGILS
jgi:RNA polymerase sigma-70 factor, ECF subfamily